MSFRRSLPIRFVGTVLLTTLSSASMAAPISWSSESYFLGYLVEAGNNQTPGQSFLQDVYTVNSGVSATATDGASSATSTGSFSYVGDTYSVVFGQTATSNDDTANRSGYAQLEASLDNTFTASGFNTLYVKYTISALVHANGVAPALGSPGAFTYADIYTWFLVDGTPIYWLGPDDWIGVDLKAAGSEDSVQVTKSDTLAIPLTLGSSYDISVYLGSWSFTSGTSNADAPLSATFSFSSTPFEPNPPIGTVPEPQGIALLALGLVGLAGTRRIRRQKH